MTPARTGAPVFAWLTTAVVIAGVLTAWADPIAGHFLNAAALALAAAWLILYGLKGGTHWLLIPLLSVCAWGIVQLSLQWTVYRYETWNAVTAWLARAAFLHLGFATLKDRRIRESVLSALLCCGALLSIVGITQWFTANRDEVMGIFLNRDHYSVFVELILPIALTRALLGAGPGFLYALASAFIYASVVGSGSRAGTVLVTLEASVIIAVACIRNTNEYRRILAVVASMAVCTFAAGWQYVWFRFQEADPLAFRREMALATLQMIQAHPLTGFGLGTWPAAYPAFAVFDPPGIFMNHAHNDWLEWISDGGIPLAMALQVVAYASVTLARRNWWALGVPVALLHAAVDFPMQKPAIAALAFFVLGVAAAVAKTTNSRTSGRNLDKGSLPSPDEEVRAGRPPYELDEPLTEYNKPSDRSSGGFLSSLAVHATVIVALFATVSQPGTQRAVRPSFTLVAPPPPRSVKPLAPRPHLPSVRPQRSALIPPRPRILPEPIILPAAPVLAAAPAPALPRVLLSSTPIPVKAPMPAVRVETGLFASRPAIVSSEPIRVMPVTGFPSSEPVEAPSRTAALQESGFGDSIPSRQVPAGARGSIRAGGFSLSSHARATGPVHMAKAVVESGFGAMAPAESPSAPTRRPPPVAPESVQILARPRPAYTAEARDLQIEGEVVLETVFTAQGEVLVVRVLRGLGHGLDENAVAAARGIRFIPAQRDGKPVDLRGTVRLTFQLAY
jgi:TonB family protein